jgi:excinuclease ABC subunit C
MDNKLKYKLKDMPTGPGVYLMKDEAGAILYAGKAASLRKRVASYFKPPERLDPKTRVLTGKIVDIETILCSSEKEALILESNLIKKHRPRYNVVLKDDKRYPSLRLDPRQAYPNLSIVRKIQKDGALYFGPYASAHAVRQTLRFIDKHFRLRKCRNREFRQRTRPCLHCQMQRCLAPCCTDVSAETYAEAVQEVVLFLKGKTPELIRELENRMREAAEHRRYEQAARLRDKIVALKKTLESHVAVTTDFKNRDAVAAAVDGNDAMIALIPVRGGYMTGAREFFFSGSPVEDRELIEAFVKQYYESAPFVPEEVLLQMPVEGQALLEERLGEIRGKRVRLLNPKRGEKARLIQMAMQNAAERLKERQAAARSERRLLERLQRRLRLPHLPERIECFDNSNLFGADAVASMVVFEHGRSNRSAYRRYRIRTVEGPNDYASMAEVLGRRCREDPDRAPLPDLLLVDGGRGQLGIAERVTAELGLAGQLRLAGIAKKNPAKGEAQDKVYLPGRINPVNFGKDADLLLFLQRVRDEAHRFAVSYHRQRRRKVAVRSDLDAVPGIGKKRKEALLRHFGGLEAMAAATAEQLADVEGMNQKAAEALKAHLSNRAADEDGFNVSSTPPGRPHLRITK